MIARRRKGWIGVDIGTRCVKLAQIEQDADGTRLLDARIIPRSVDSAAGDQTEEEIGTARNEIECALSLGRKFSGSAAACSVSAEHCRFRPIRIPLGSAAEQRLAVSTELDTVENAPPSGRWFSFWHTGVPSNDSDASGSEVIAHSMSRQCSARVATDVLRAGLFSRALDSPPLALGRAVAMTAAAGEDEPVAALDWGFSAATFCVIQGGVPIFARRLRDCGFRHVLACLKAVLGVSLEEAECLFATEGDAAKPRLGDAGQVVQEAVPEMAAPPLNRMVTELHRTLRFLKNGQACVVPRKMWLFGAGSLWANACDYFASHIEPRSQTWRLGATRIEHPEDLDPTSSLFAMAIGSSCFPWSGQ
ncbi:MAG: hypothetical protein ACODAD_04990 [Planctomycetota bacterium]